MLLSLRFTILTQNQNGWDRRPDSKARELWEWLAVAEVKYFSFDLWTSRNTYWYKIARNGFQKDQQWLLIILWKMNNADRVFNNKLNKTGCTESIIILTIVYLNLFKLVNHINTDTEESSRCWLLNRWTLLKYSKKKLTCHGITIKKHNSNHDTIIKHFHDSFFQIL